MEHVHGPILVLAGAGSGKTRVLTTRIAHLIDRHGVPPERIFAVTFTNKAAGEMKQRIGRLLDRDPSGLWIGTFHSLSARLLRREAELLGFGRQFTIYDEDDRLSLIRRLMDQRGHSTKLFPPRAVQSLISVGQEPDGAARRSWPPACRSSTGWPRSSADVYAAMGPALKAANAMDFDDLLLHPLTLFREHPDRLRAYQARFSFVLVDEFQDTNRAQYELIRLLGAHGNVCAVGDDDQSIYGWRGADVRNMQEFLKDFPGARLVRLEENYRSTQVVLDAANGVIAENSGRIGKTLTTRRRGGEPVTLLAAADERDEAEWVVRELERRSAAGDWGYRDMAVLYRTNAQSRALEEAFRRAGVPYRLIGAISFYERREVKDLLAYLRLLANPADDEAFLRAVGVPRRGLGETSLAMLGRTRWRSGASRCSTRRAVADGITDLRPNVREAFRDVRRAHRRRWRERAQQLPPADVLEQVIRAIDYEARAARRGARGRRPLGERARARGQRRQLVGGGDRRGARARRSSGFWPRPPCCRPPTPSSGNEEGVTLMTLHTAKGLEWPVVVLTGLEHGLFPLARAEEQPDGLEEERRLCYVGLTRAKDKLYLTWARARRRGGELRPGMPSRFLRGAAAGHRRRAADDRRSGRRTGGAGGPTAAGAGSGRRPLRQSRWRRAGRRARRRAPPEEVSQDTPRYVKGERVRHRRFGSGTIQGLDRHRAGTSRSRWRSTTPKSASSSCSWPTPGSSANGRAHEHRSRGGASTWRGWPSWR